VVFALSVLVCDLELDLFFLVGSLAEGDFDMSLDIERESFRVVYGSLSPDGVVMDV
jgi:hypothetical protein